MGTRHPNRHETAATAFLPPAAVAAADSPATAVRVGGGGSAADSPSPQGSLSHPLGTVQTMGTRELSQHETTIAGLLPPAAGATADTPAACHPDAGGSTAADSQGSLSHPLGTVQTMGTRELSQHETTIAGLLPPAAGATADTPAACHPDAGGSTAADSQGSLSHPLGTVQTMGTRQSERTRNGHRRTSPAKPLSPLPTHRRRMAVVVFRVWCLWGPRMFRGVWRCWWTRWSQSWAVCRRRGRGGTCCAHR